MRGDDLVVVMNAYGTHQMQKQQHSHSSKEPVTKILSTIILRISPSQTVTMTTTIGAVTRQTATAMSRGHVLTGNEYYTINNVYVIVDMLL